MLEGFDSPRVICRASRRSARARRRCPRRTPCARICARRCEGLPFRADLFEPFLRDVQQAAQGSRSSSAPAFEGTSLALKVDSLLLVRGSAWTAMLPLRGVRDCPPSRAKSRRCPASMPSFSI